MKVDWEGLLKYWLVLGGICLFVAAFFGFLFLLTKLPTILAIAVVILLFFGISVLIYTESD